MIYFTSDTHFGHENVIKYCSRPYRDKWEMDKALINAWNARVQPTDTIFHLGDFAFAHDSRIEEIINQLAGQKILIFGNHDKGIRKSKLRHLFSSCHDDYELVEQGQLIILHHYPKLTWHKIHRGSWMLHGHCHGNIKRYPYNNRIHDAGVDPNGYAPISFDEVKRIMAKKGQESPDHHTAGEPT